MGRFYIGGTTNLEQRIDRHLSNIKNGSRDIDGYIDLVNFRHTFSVTILEEVHDIGELQALEQRYIDQNIANERCVNACKKASKNMRVKRLLETGNYLKQTKI